MLDSVEFLKPTCNFSYFAVSDVYLFTVKLVRFWVSLNPDDLADTDVNLRQVWECFNNLLLLGLLLLFGFLLLCWCICFCWSSLSFALLRSLFIVSRRCFGITSSSLESFLLRLILLLGKLFELRLARSFTLVIREADKHAKALNLFKHTWQVLNMVNPSKTVRELYFLEVHEVSEM